MFWDARRFLGALWVAVSWASAAGVSPTFHKQIAPILYGHCTSCHRPGESAPFALLTYADARKRAAQIAAVTRSRFMPPWLPEPGHGEFDGERRLSEAQIALIGEWAAAGAPEGDPKDAPPTPVFTPGWQLGTPDLVVSATKPFRVPAEGSDVFWNFVLTPSIKETRYVKAIEIRPGNASSVHHANMLVDRSRSARRQEKTPGDGFPGMDLVIPTDTFDPDSHFLFWKPGGTPWIEPEGLAWRLDPGNDLVLNFHFKITGKAEVAQPSVGLYFSKQAQTKFPMLIQLEHDGALNVPPGVRDFLVSDDFKLPVDVDVLAVYPHAHYLGHVLEGYATLPDGGRRWLVRIPDWDLNWQAVYRYRWPVFLPKGTVISMRFHYDNSSGNPRNPASPPKLVTGGDRSTDEMGHLWLQVLPRGGDQRAVLQEAVMRRRLEKYPGDFSANFNLGALLLGRQEIPAAIELLKDAVRAEPQQPVALNTLGAALESGGRLDEALEQFRNALRMEPGYGNARYNMANTLAAQGKFEEAAKGFRKVLADSPDDTAARSHLVAALMELGESADSEGRLTAAAGSFREIVLLDPTNVEARNNLGVILARSGDMEGAIEQFEAALRADPSNSAARENLERARKKPPK
jgi:tetratricopeptide (TPR) repeat protein